MKKFITRLTSLIFVLAIIASACPVSFAESVIRIDDIQYVVDGNKASVYKYVGDGGKVSIRSKVNGISVTSIGNYAFAEDYDNTDSSKRITSVTIPDTVKTIGKGAFMECTALKSIELPISLTTLGDTVFWYCESLEKVIAFPDLKVIGDKVFYGCSEKLKVCCVEGSVIEKYAKSYSIKTESVTPTSLKLNKSSITLNKGETYTLKATVKPSTSYFGSVVWSSANKSVASVSQSGKVTANKYGKTKITCQTLFADLSKTVTVNVSVPKVEDLKCTNKTYTGYTVSWKKVSGASGYTLQKYENDEWKTVKSTTETKYTFKDLKQGSSCKYRVRAYANQNSTKFRGAWSEVLTASTKAVGKITNLQVSKCLASSIKITWDKASNADGYEIYLYNGKTKKYEKIYTTSKNYYTHEGLNSGTKYSYRVRAYVKSGNTKIRGYYSSLTAYTAPSKVTGVRSGGATKSTLTVKWNSIKNATGYQVSVTGNNYKKTVTTTDTKYKLTGLSKNTKYTIKVRAYIKVSDKKFYGSYSNSVSLSTNYIPSSVTDIVEEFNDAFLKTTKASSIYGVKATTLSAKVTDKSFSDRKTANTVNALVDSFNKTSSSVLDVSGKDTKSVIDFFTGSDKVSSLSASAVKSATCVKDGSGYFVTLKLKQETSKNDSLPKSNSKLGVGIDWDHVSSLCSPDAVISSNTTTYTGTTVKGKINKSGKFDTLIISAPFTAKLKGKVNDKSCSLTLNGTKSVDFVLTWW